MGVCVLLNVTLHGQKGKQCPAQLQQWYLKMKRTVAASSDIEIRKPDDNCQLDQILFTKI